MRQPEGKWRGRWNVLLTAFQGPLFPLGTLSFLLVAASPSLVYHLSGPAISGLSRIREMRYLEEQSEECMTPSQPRRAGELYWTPDLVGSLAFCLVLVSPGACAMFTGLAFCYKLWGQPRPPSWHHMINHKENMSLLLCLTPQIRSPPMWTHL